ncbi:MAG: hypothetical protein KF752_01750 [Pirellulaceae bacterium]|nr:hypothetical protein [Pirellulaceae bacterium]
MPLLYDSPCRAQSAGNLPIVDGQQHELRCVWGGSVARGYEGSISLVGGGTIQIVRNLGMQQRCWEMLQQTDSTTIHLRPHGDTTFGGVDIRIRGPLSSRLVFKLRNPGTDQWTQCEFGLDELQQQMKTQALDEQGNRLALERPIHDRVRVNDLRAHTVFDCNDTWTMQVAGLRTGLAEGDYVLTAHWAGGRSTLPVSTAKVRVDADGDFTATKLEVKIPAKEGAHKLALQLVRPNLLSNWMSVKPLLARSVDIVALDDSAAIPTISGWKPQLAIDTAVAARPGSFSWLATFATQARHQTTSEISDLLKLSERNLPEQWNRLLPHSRPVSNLGNVTRVGNIGTRDYYSIAPSTTNQSSKCATIGPEGWLALPLSGLQAGQPHRLRIEVPTDTGTTLNVSIHDQRPEWSTGPVPQSTVVIEVGDRQSVEGSLTHDLIFWPEAESISIVLANVSRHSAASVGKLLLETAELVSSTESPGNIGDRLASVDSPTADRQGVSSRSTSYCVPRSVGMYLDQPLLADCFAAPRQRDSANQPPLETWETWLAVAQRLVHSLQLAGADTLVLSALSAEGSLMPLKSQVGLHLIDKATFFADGRSPDVHDVVELILRHMDRTGLSMILEVDLSRGLQVPSVASQADAELFQADIQGQFHQRNLAFTALPSHLNPAHKLVQSTISASLQEIAQRYGHHRSFAGISLRLDEESQLVFAGQRWGYSPGLMRDFTSDTSVTLPRDVAQREQLLQGPARLGYLTWRAQRMTEFYRQLAEIVRSAQPRSNLYLNVLPLTNSDVAMTESFASDLTARNPQQILLNHGLDLITLSEVDGLVVVQGATRDSWKSMAAKNWGKNLGADQAVELVQTPIQAAFVTHQPRLQRLSSPGKESASESDRELRIYPEYTQHGRHARQALIEQLARTDLRMLAFGGWHPIWCTEAELSPLLTTFKSLPATIMRDPRVLASDAPIRIRTGTADERWYLSILNTSPLNATVTIVFAEDTQADWEILGQRDFQPLDLNNRSMKIQVPAYDMLGWSRIGQDVHIQSAEYMFSSEALAATSQDIENFEKLLVMATDPSQQKLLFKLGGSFEHWNAANRPVGWNVSTLPNTIIQQESELPHSGSSSLSIQNNNSGQVAAWIQSEPIELPETGRLAVRAWLRMSAADNRQPLVRLGLVGRLKNGQRYEHSSYFGGTEGNPARPLANDWGRRPAELQVADLPVDELKELQVAIDLIGPGKIWVDDVEVVQTWLHPDERNYLRGQLLVIKQKLAENDPYPAAKLLQSPWNHYLLDLEQSLAVHMALAQPNAEPPKNPAQWNRTKSPIQQWRDGWLDRWRR